MPSGVNGGLGSTGNASPEKRGEVSGWSAASARRNMRFLKSVDIDQLSCVAFAYTLTVRDVPETHEEWKTLVDRLRKGIYRRGAVSDHWVIEWTKKGRPHLHGVVYLPDNIPPVEYMAAFSGLTRHWLKLTRHLRTEPQGQFVAQIRDNIGWFQYMSKHASRGAAHYQRERSNLPKGWYKTGRMWGKGGSWPVSETAFKINQSSYYRFRRLLRSYLLSDCVAKLRQAERFSDHAVARYHTRRLVYLRGMLRNHDPNASRVRGVNEWVPEHVLRDMLAHLLSYENANVAYCSDERQPLHHPKLSHSQKLLANIQKRTTTDEIFNSPH